ncbi:MAG: replicative helicase, partial [Candidatus Hydrogenedentes bacterium]|nr:replicative helicase [Candidatus Hydrogenedentota bacterium]
MAAAREAQAAFERTPPQNIQAERAVLGAMLVNQESVAAAFEILREDAADLFYAGPHQYIFAAMTALFSNNVKVDEVTVGEQLTRDGRLEAAGGYSYLGDLIGAAPLSSSVEHYANIVLDNAVLRKLISSCAQIGNEAYEHRGEVAELLDAAESTIFKIAEYRQFATITAVGDLVHDTVIRIEELKKSGSGVTGLATGFHELDSLLSGLQPSDMIVLAARPSVGKTALALNIARHVGIHLTKSVLVFSLEMSKAQLMLRLFCMQGQLDFRRLREGFLSGPEFGRIQQAADKLTRAKIYIDDSPNITILDVRARARRHAQQHDLDLIVIDYLQLMTGRHRAENRQVEIAEISRGIKGLARELNIPVIALSQLSREAERDDSGMPKLSHLRESGAIEQDADVVLMLARPPKEDEEKTKHSILTLAVAKQRNGPTGNIELRFDGPYQRFESLADPQKDHG